MSDGITIHRASRPARIVYAIAHRLVPALIGWLILHRGRRSLAERVARVGAAINRAARGQRLRRFAGIGFIDHPGAPVPVQTVYRLAGGRPLWQGAILYFHGGGFITGGLDSHRHVVAALAARSGMPVVHVDYRQYPQVGVDGSVEDCVAAYRWLLAQGADPARTVLAGDSAGGFLAFATALAAQRAGLPAPAGVVGISALLELDEDGRAGHPNTDRDAFGIPAVWPSIAPLVCPVPRLRHDLAPINGPLATMPPALLIVGESEILRADAERLHTALLAAHRPSRLEIFDHELHAFPALFPGLPDSRLAYRLIVDFAAERVAEADEHSRDHRDVS